MSLIGKSVSVYRKKDDKITEFKGEVVIVDKVLTNMARYFGSPIMNNASMEVYLGIDQQYPTKIVAFLYTDIIEILTNN